MDSPHIFQLRRMVLQRLECLQQAGVLDLPRPRAAPTPLSPMEGTAERETVVDSVQAVRPLSMSTKEEFMPRKTARHRSPTETAPSAGVSAAADSLPESREECAAALDAMSRTVASCRRCQELAEMRTQTVFGVGNPQARLVMLGERARSR